jgi:hypothetical protein
MWVRDSLLRGTLRKSNEIGVNLKKRNKSYFSFNYPCSFCKIVLKEHTQTNEQES